MGLPLPPEIIAKIVSYLPKTRSQRWILVNTCKQLQAVAYFMLDYRIESNAALKYAVRVGDIELLDRIIAHGAVKLDAENNHAIRTACSVGQLQVVQRLLKQPSVDPACFQHQAFYLACEHGHVEVVKLLLEDGRADPAARKSLSFIVAAEKGFKSIVTTLLTRSNPDEEAIARAIKAVHSKCFLHTDMPSFLSQVLIRRFQHPQSYEQLESALTYLSEIVSSVPFVAKEMSRTPNLIVELLSTLPRGTKRAKERAAYLLSFLIFKFKHLKHQLVRAGGASLCLRLLVSDADDELKVHVSCILCYTKAKDMICRGGIQTMVSLLNSAADHDVKLNAAFCLKLQASNPENARRIIEVGGLSALFTAIQEGRNNQAAAALTQLAKHSQCKAIVEFGGLHMLISALRDVATTDEVKEDVAGALWHISTEADYCLSIVEAGGIEALVGLLSHPRNSYNAVGTLRRILANSSNNEAVKQRIMLSGGFDALAEVFQSVWECLNDKTGDGHRTY